MLTSRSQPPQLLSAWESGGSIICQPLMLSMRTLAKPEKPSLLSDTSVPFMETSILSEHLCIIPIYGCETWLLDATTIKMLESFQCEIGCRILRLPKQLSKKSGETRIAVALGSYTHILIHKLTFLTKLLANTEDIIRNRFFMTRVTAACSRKRDR